jgi:hypothetical protein
LDLKCGKIYELGLTLPCRVDPMNSDAIFMTESRKLRFFGRFHQQEDQMDDWNDECEELAGGVTGEKNILEENRNRINEKGIKLETNLLDDLV